MNETARIVTLNRRLEAMTDAEAQRLTWWLFGHAVGLSQRYDNSALDAFERSVSACLWSNPKSAE